MNVPSNAASRTRTLVHAGLLALTLAAIRLLTLRANLSIHGDFFATLPGAYVETLNPTLWNSPDLAASWGFHRSFYYYGPSQYLTLYLIGFLKSYAQIAALLSCVYAAVIAGAIAGLSRLVRPSSAAFAPGVVVLSLLFAPLLQAYLHVEFEVVVFAVIVAATFLLVRRRDGTAGALLGYIAWFKIWPVVFLGYFLAKRQFRAVAGFALASVVTLAIAHAAFGLDRFIVLNPSLARSIPGRQFFLSTLVGPMEVGFEQPFERDTSTGLGFCNGWVRSNETSVSVRWGMCGLIFNYGWPGGVAVFYGMLIVFACLGIAGLLAVQRRGDANDADRTCRVACEVSLLIIAGALTFVAHYYYFIFLLMPISVLTYRFVDRRSWLKLGGLAVSYGLLGGLVGPLWLTWRLMDKNFWAFYAGQSIYLPGLVLLTGILMWEYLSLGRGVQSPVPIDSERDLGDYTDVH